MLDVIFIIALIVYVWATEKRVKKIEDDLAELKYAVERLHSNTNI